MNRTFPATSQTAWALALLACLMVAGTLAAGEMPPRPETSPDTPPPADGAPTDGQRPREEPGDEKAGAKEAGAEETEGDPAERLMARFLDHVAKQKDLPKEARTAIETMLRNPQTGGADPAILAEAIVEFSPAYRAAAVALNGDKFEAAEAALKPLLTDEDPWIAAQATVAQARMRMRQERFTEALPLTEAIRDRHAPYTLYRADALFWRGQCEWYLLKPEAATATLTTYLETYLGPPAMRRAPAEALLQRIAAYEPESLQEAEQLMDYARRKLTRADTGTDTQTRQDEIVSLLDKAIAKAEEEQKKQQQQQQQQQQASAGSGQGQGGAPQGANPSSQGAKQSSLTGGADQMGALGSTRRGSPRETWGAMPKREREAVESMLKERFPARYQEIVRRYYVDLQKDPE